MDFHFFWIFIFAHGSTWYNLWYNYLNSTLKFWIFSKCFSKFCSVRFLDLNPLLLSKSFLAHTCKSKGDNWGVYGRLDLEVISKSFKEIEKTSNFHKFWNEELHYEKWPPKKKLWHLSVIISWISLNEELWFLRLIFNKVQDHIVIFLILHFIFFEENYFSNYIKI